MNCPKCGSDRITTERRPDGVHRCTLCHHSWPNTPVTQTANTVPVAPVEDLRYKLISGKFGFYYVDSQAGTELTLEQVLAILNDHEVLRLQHSLLKKDYDKVVGEPQV